MRHSSYVARSVLPLAVLAVAALTLTPGGGKGYSPLEHCLVCGSRGLADAILNVLLFVPVGAGLWLWGVRPRRALLLGAALTLAIETAQMMIPGRDPSPGDLLFNTLGAGLGIALPLLLRRSLASPARASRHSLVAGLAAVCIIALTGWLLRPELPPIPYYGQWTANLGHFEWYRGTVLEARIGDLPVPSHRLPESAQVRDQLLAGAPVRVRALAGPWPMSLAPILSIYNGGRREVMLLGADRDDLVLRYGSRAIAWRLDQPDLRIEGLLRGVPVGARLDLDLRGGIAAPDLVVNGREMGLLRYSVGRGWGLLLYPEQFAGWLKRLLDAGWLAAMFLPVGFWARPRRRWGLAGSAVAFAGLWLIPPAAMLHPVGPFEPGAALAGWVVGLMFGRWAATWPPEPTWPSERDPERDPLATPSRPRAAGVSPPVARRA